MSKPRVAIFDFACCEGCQLQIVNMEAEIVDLISVIDPVEWREAMSEQSEEYDIAIIEGSITRPEDEERIKEIRERAAVLVTLGACSSMGGVNKLKNNFDIAEAKKCVYKDDSEMPHLNTETTKAVDEVVKVDFKIPGCPINAKEFAYIVRCLAIGKTPVIPNVPVCVECKKNENPCRFEYGEICLGPVTLGGCDSACPSGGMWCYGCRGILEDANINAANDIMAEYGKTMDDLKSRMAIYNSK